MGILHEEYRERYRLLGLRIAYYRKCKGYTQEQFAERIGKSWSFISQVEANNGSIVKGISLDTLFCISDVLEVPVSKFLEELWFVSGLKKDRGRGCGHRPRPRPL